MPKKVEKPQTIAQESPLSEAQSRAVMLLATGATNREIAQSLGVSECTISRWKQSPDFVAGINEIQKEARASAIARLRLLAEQAVECIERVMVSTESTAGDKLRAAAMVLDRLGIDAQAGSAIGCTDADELRRRQARDEAAEIAEAELAASWDL